MSLENDSVYFHVVIHPARVHRQLMIQLREHIMVSVVAVFPDIQVVVEIVMPVDALAIKPDEIYFFESHVERQLHRLKNHADYDERPLGDVHAEMLIIF